MSDPTRLFDGAGSDDERRLIGIVRADTPPHGSFVRTLSAVGVGGGVLASGVAHGAALGSSTAAGAGVSGSGAAGTSVTVAVVAKWLAIGIAGGALTVATTELVDSSGSDAPPQTRPRPMRPNEPLTRTIATPNEPDRTAKPPSSNAPTRPSSPVVDDRGQLSEELALLERARRSLAEGRSDEARDALKRHREAFPSGALAEEAAVLRIEVLLARGENALAEQAGRDFLDAHPKSPHAPRVRDLLVRAGHDPRAKLRP